MRVTARMAVGTLVSNLDRSYERITRFQRSFLRARDSTRCRTIRQPLNALWRCGLSCATLNSFKKARRWNRLVRAERSHAGRVRDPFVEVRGLAVGATVL